MNMQDVNDNIEVPDVSATQRLLVSDSRCVLGERGHAL